VKRLPIDTYEAVGEDEVDFEEPTGADFGTARTGETTDTDEPNGNVINPEDFEGEDSGEKANPKCPNPDGSSNTRMASNCELCPDGTLKEGKEEGICGCNRPDTQNSCGEPCVGEPNATGLDNNNDGLDDGSNLPVDPLDADPNTSGAKKRVNTMSDINGDVILVPENRVPASTNPYCGTLSMRKGYNTATQSALMAYESAHGANYNDNLEAIREVLKHPYLDSKDTNEVKAAEKAASNYLDAAAKSEAEAIIRLKEFYDTQLDCVQSSLTEAVKEIINGYDVMMKEKEEGMEDIEVIIKALKNNSFNFKDKYKSKLNSLRKDGKAIAKSSNQTVDRWIGLKKLNGKCK